MTDEEIEQRCNDEQKLAQDIMDEACLSQHLYERGVVTALQATIAVALRKMRELGKREVNDNL